MFVNIKNERSIAEIQQYWESRAMLGQEAGSRDVIAKVLEIEAIAKYVKAGMHILEVGCGNGITAIELAKRYEVEIVGLDYAEKMVQAANLIVAEETLCGKVTFMVGDVGTLDDLGEKYDLIYTERVLINLKDWEAQRKAIVDITHRLRPGGAYVMCENSMNGLEKINEFRGFVGISPINPPWHNIYFKDEDLNALEIPGIKLEKVDCYSSTYYFLSRVVNAWLAKEEGKEPAYDATVNRLALKLPAFGDMAQGRIWLWRNTLD